LENFLGMAVIGAKGNFAGPGASFDGEDEKKHEIVCTQEDTVSAVLLSTVGLLGVSTNLFLILIIFINKHMRRWNHGLVVHQAMVELLRSVILLPLGKSLLNCHIIENCSFIETLFLLFVSVSTINLLTCVLDNTPILHEDIGNDTRKILKNGPQCVAFGIFIIWFSSITLNLGPTFLSGAIASGYSKVQPSCPLVQGPGRHYVSNALWIIINIFCLIVTFYQLRRLDREYKQRQSVLVLSDFENERFAAMGAKIQMYWVVSCVHAACWVPLYCDTLIQWTSPDQSTTISHEVSLHIGFLHSTINPLLYLLLDTRIRVTIFKMFCCIGDNGREFKTKDEPCRPELNHRINSTNEDDHDRFNSIEEEVSKDKTNFNFKNSFFHDEFKVSEI